MNNKVETFAIKNLTIANMMVRAGFDLLNSSINRDDRVSRVYIFEKTTEAKETFQKLIKQDNANCIWLTRGEVEYCIEILDNEAQTLKSSGVATSTIDSIILKLREYRIRNYLKNDDCKA